MIATAALAGLFAAASVAEPVRLREDAPDRHVVVKGDTLWDISAKFLKDPWLWPEVWRLNREEIRNPHLIYPGDVILLQLTAAGPRLSRMETVRLGPSMHSEPIPRGEAIPSVPYAAVKSFLQRPLVAGGALLAEAPALLGSEDGRVMVTTGDRVYAAGIDGDARDWHVVRIGKPLVDPDSGREIAREVEYVGDARTLVAGNPATLVVRTVEREVLAGDRLIPALQEVGLDFLPRPPQAAVNGRIISAYGGTQASGKYSTVVINKGRADGLDVGHVLAVYREGRALGPAGVRERMATFSPKSGYLDAAKERQGQIEYANFGEEVVDFADPFDFFFKPFPDGRRGWRYMDYKCLQPGGEVAADRLYDPAAQTRDCPAGEDKLGHKWAYMDIGCLKHGKQIRFGEEFDPKEVYAPHCRPLAVKLPDVRNGLVMVYRVFDRVSYALVLEAASPLYLLDSVRNPEAP
jgi:hypothetical protein